jgi:hypothetical protein
MRTILLSAVADHGEMPSGGQEKARRSRWAAIGRSLCAGATVRPRPTAAVTAFGCNGGRQQLRE